MKYPKGMQTKQAFTNETFTWNGFCWVSNRNSNVKINDLDYEYESVIN